MAANPVSADEDLRRCLDVIFRLESVHLIAGGEPMILHRISVAAEKPACLEPIGADMAGHHHAIELRGAGGTAGEGG
jgi:hypothetical protein